MAYDYTNTRFNYAGKVYCPADWFWNGSNLKDYDLWTLLKGKGYMETSDSECNEYKLKAGDCFLLRPRKNYIFSHDPSDPLVVIFIHFDFMDLNETFLPPLYRNIGNNTFFIELLERVVAAKAPDNDFWLKAVMKELSSIDLRSISSGPKKPARYWKIDDICREINKMPGFDWSIQRLADATHYSKDHFIRVFRKVKGMTPNEYIIRARINAAKTYLSQSSMKIENISQMLGYSDMSYFTKQFRKIEGLTPSKYRDNI